MLILNRIGGMELGRAFGFVKAISKRNREIIDDRGAEFLNGARERGLDQQTAVAILHSQHNRPTGAGSSKLRMSTTIAFASGQRVRTSAKRCQQVDLSFG